jgi:hypothetical protein
MEFNSDGIYLSPIVPAPRGGGTLIRWAYWHGVPIASLRSTNDGRWAVSRNHELIGVMAGDDNVRSLLWQFFGGPPFIP